MKATGIVRRIDDLGRVVIPKEIRRQLRIREGDPLEIFIEDNIVCFKRYEVEREFVKDLKDLKESITAEYDSLGNSREMGIINLAFEEIRLQLRAMEEKKEGEDY